MFRGRTHRSALTLLTTLLLTLQFFAPADSFASAHTIRHVEAKTPSGSEISGKASRDGTGTHRDTERFEEQPGPSQARDRRRAAVSRRAHERRRPARATATPRPASAPGAVHHRIPRPSRAHTPAVLQVFRC
ncbi:hypothetical protein CTZ28_26620 [Streptomyces shenzhenensis]|uniref:Secreted protein n=1 Tax=Streptomyces shenzhenensis TaxID=943815 RepID=A0A3M0I825_9ACTN|nr:hypothetical protein CTZ28_26620 [Streptomyces shenzhenensis]